MAQVNRKNGYFLAEKETLSPGERRKDLHRKLQKIVKYAYENAPAFKDVMDRAGLTPTEIKTISDLEKVPVIGKTDLIALQKKNPPFGGLNGVAPEMLRRIFVSPGPIYEPGEMHYDDTRWAQALWAARFRPGDICQITFGFHLTPFAFMLDESLKMLGCRTIPAGFGNTEVQVQILRDMNVTGFLGTPSFLNTIIEKAREMKFRPKKDFKLKTAFVAAEMLPESLRQAIESSLGITVRQSYGTADIGCLGFECAEKNGMHFPADCIVEIVDPASGRQLGPGEVGEVVGTCFNRVYPLIRFGTGDLSYYNDEPCPCGRTSGRLVKIIGRVDQVTKVKGMFIHPGLVDQVAAKFPEICACQVVVTRERHQDKMLLRVELTETCLQPEELRARVALSLQDILRVRGEVEILPRGAIPAGAKKIEDRRTWE